MEELTMLNLIVDQYLSFAELQARQRKPMHMKDWERKLNDFLKLNERDILTHAGKISSRLSDEIAGREFDKYRTQQRQIEKTPAPVPHLEAAVNTVRVTRRPKKKS